MPEVVVGRLSDAEALRRLAEGAAVVIHAAGLIKAPSRERFFSVNAGGAAAAARIVREVAPEARFVLVSSLTAREPQLSDYAASKAADHDLGHEAAPAGSQRVAAGQDPEVIAAPGQRGAEPAAEESGGAGERRDRPRHVRRTPSPGRWRRPGRPCRAGRRRPGTWPWRASG